MRKCVLFFVLLGLVPTVYAQEGRRGAGAAPFVRVSVEPETLKGAPYSAEVINESVQTLADGNRIVRRTTSRVYRDSEGRVRREEDRPSGSPGVSINDPVAQTSWSLDLDNHTARQNPLPLRVYNSLLTVGGELERLTVQLNGIQATARVEERPGGAAFITRPGAGEQNTEEKLTPRTIEGLRVEGVRRTSTIAAGAIGNERAIVVTTEEWTSPDLKVLVLSETNDPRTGTSSHKLVNVRRGDPPASLFQVPADYTVVQGPAGGRGGRGGRQ
jgi:hypothetical protein